MSAKQIAEVQDFAEDLKYPLGSLFYGGNDEDDYLYCLPNNRELDVCRVMMRILDIQNLNAGCLQCRRETLQIA